MQGIMTGPLPEIPRCVKCRLAGLEPQVRPGKVLGPVPKKLWQWVRNRGDAFRSSGVTSSCEVKGKLYGGNSF